MFKSDFNVQFARRPSGARWRLIIVLLGLVVLTLIWIVVPPTTLYWMLLPLIAILVWVASYGWRGALAALHEILHRLDQF